MKRMAVCLICIVRLWLPHECSADEGPETVFAPVSPASVPLALAVKKIPRLRLRWFENHSRAHALFLRKDAPILCTGLSVGVRFFERGRPVRIIGSHVSGMTYLVSAGPVRNFRALRGRLLALPFEGSPIAEVTRFFMAREGLAWGRDIPVTFSPFSASAARLKEGRIQAAALPEPFVSLLLENGAGRIAFGYADRWETLTGSVGGYPQIGLFVLKDWAGKNRSLIRELLNALERAAEDVSHDPRTAAVRAGGPPPLSPDLAEAALRRTRFRMLRGAPLRQAVTDYYRILGTPPDASLDAFFLTD